MRRGLIPVLVLVLFAAFIGAFPSIPVTHATITAVQSNAVSATCNATCTLLLTETSVTAGNLLVAGVTEFGANIVISMVDNQGTSFTQTCKTNGANGQACIFYGLAAATTSNERFTFSESVGGTAMYMQAVELHNFNTQGICFASGSGSGTAVSTSTTCTFDVSDSYLLEMTSTTAAVVPTVFSAGTGFTTLQSPGGSGAGTSLTCPLLTSNGNQCEFALPAAGVTNPTSFPATWQASGNWESQAIFVPEHAQTTVIVIAACNFYQLQCWWFPMLFMGAYAGIVLLVAAMLGTTPRGKAHVFLSALTMGSLVGVIFGVMNIVVPLILLILNTIIALRLRG